MKKRLAHVCVAFVMLNLACSSDNDGQGGDTASLDAGPITGECETCYYYGGEFGDNLMGCDPSFEPDCADYPESTPRHRVLVGDAYMLMRSHEVTQQHYAECISSGACITPESNFDPSERALYPVTNVTWEQAQSYCVWAGGRLPTEAEWEANANYSPFDSYPWGDDPPTCDLASYAGCDGGPWPAVTDETARSGRYNFAGNVAEWVYDFYDPNYYEETATDPPPGNPMGPETGDTHVIRGGGFNDEGKDLRVWVRKPGAPGPDVGFR